MNNFDDLLQQHIQSLNEGQPVEEILGSLAPDEQDLAPLIQLVASIQNVPHPAPGISHLHEILSEIQPTSKEKERKMYGNVINNTFERLIPKSRKGWLLPAGLAAAALVILLTFAAVLTFNFFGEGMNADTVVLKDIQGDITVAHVDNSTRWSPGENGQHLASGSLIRSGQGSSATLFYPDGSSMLVGPSTSLTLTHVSGGKEKPLQVVITQDTGNTQHTVVPFSDQNSQYLVFTPSGVISVHGTRFGVQIDPQGRSRVAVDEGKVLFTNEASQVYLLPGQVTSAGLADEITAPSYQFGLQGEINRQMANVWMVSGVPVTRVETTQLQPDLHEGDQVVVVGQVLPSGEWVADSIVVTSDNSKFDWFYGKVLSIDGNTWETSVWDVVVDSKTKLDANIAIGDTVRVQFSRMADGSLLAKRIERVGGPDFPDYVGDPNARPSLEFESDELLMAACNTETAGLVEFPGRIMNTASEVKDVANDVRLEAQVIKGHEYLTGPVVIEPGSISTIAAGGGEDFSISFTTNELWQTAPQGAEIKVRVIVAYEQNRPDHLNGRVTATLVNTCGELLDEEEKAEDTKKEDTPSRDLTEPVSEIPTETNCTGNLILPAAEKLSQKYADQGVTVTYEEIMGWFCSGFGLGEIEVAYDLDIIREDLTVIDIFNMRIEGKGWGLIKQELDPKPTKTPKPPKPVKTVKPEKPEKPEK